MWKQTIYIHYMLCTLFGSKYGSGKAPLDVRADLRLRSMLVLRFNVDKSRANILSLVRRNQYLRLKILNPRRHRPIRQPRGAPTVLSECNLEDPRCLWHGHVWAQRPRWRYLLCLLQMKHIIWFSRPFCTLEFKHSYFSHMFDSFVVAQKLQSCLGWEVPYHCNLVLLS